MSSFSQLLRHIGEQRCVSKGREVHARIITSGYLTDSLTNNHLIAMYAKCRRMNDARLVFDAMPEPSVVSWSALINGYSQMGMAEEALRSIRMMVFVGCVPNDYTFVGALSACAGLGNVRIGKEIHGRIYRSLWQFDRRVSNVLINMYGKSGFQRYARFVFDGILEPDTVSWTSLLSCSSQSGDSLEGLKIFLRSLKEGVSFNEFSCATVLGSCADLADLKFGIQIHTLLLKCGIEYDNFVVTGLINFYAKCGELDLACRVFFEAAQQHVSAWTALIGGYAQKGRKEEAINLFLKFHSSGRFKPNERTFASVFGAFADAEAVETGMQLHSLVIKMGYGSFTFVGNAVLNFYSKCSLLDESLRIFKEMREHDIVSWSSLIAGRVGSEHYSEAIELVKDMLSEGCALNFYTYSIILTICSNVPAMEWGKQTHCQVLKPGFDSNVVVGSALIDMYAKCGRLTSARHVFDKLLAKNLVSWNAMLVGYAQHGFGREALELNAQMLNNGIKPNEITLAGVLAACGHVGNVEEGWNYFNSMTKDHSISPTMDHLASLVNLFARKGQTKRAYELIKTFPLKHPSKVVWRCLLSGCRTHKDVHLGKVAAEEILSIDPDDTSAHIMLSNIYADAKMWDELANMRKIIKMKSLKKDTGISWLELKNKIHAFSATNFKQHHGTELVQIMNVVTIHLSEIRYAADVLFLVDGEA